MKNVWMACFCLLASVPAVADVAVVDSVAKLYGKRTRVEIKLSNPAYVPQEGPIVVTLRGHAKPTEPWVELKTWTFQRFSEGPQPLMVFRSDQLTALAKSKKFECQLSIQVPHQEALENLTRLEKLEE